jgi:hypothetical protein
MTNKQKKLIEIILEKMFNLNYLQDSLCELLDVEPLGEGGLDRVFDIGYEGIPLILGIKQDDWTDDMFYNYISGQYSKDFYFKELEKYVKEVK